MRHPVATSRIEGLLDSTRGLTAEQAKARQARYGRNDIIEAPPSAWFDVLRDTARDPMLWFLAATALLFALLGNFREAAVLGVASLPIMGMDAFLHRRTRATTRALSGRLASRARVIRDGAATDVPATELVPGDLVIVPEGWPAPADGIFVAGSNLQVDESALTGESLPVRKQPLAAPPARAAEALVDDRHWGSAGTRLLTGEGRLRVVHTGGETAYGQIIRSAQQGRHDRTPLQRAIGSLVAVLIVASASMCLVLAGVRYAQGHGAIDAFLSAVTLAVAALPEEFPVVLTFFLAVGVFRLGQRKALVRRAVAVENIGRVTCICSDKTGTLTEGRLRLAHVLPVGGVTPDCLARVAAAASRGESADPLDIALLEAGTAGACERIGTFPFTEDRRREVAVLRLPSGDLVAAAKGAPEVILAMTGLAGSERASWLAKTEALAAAGHKIIACAERSLVEWGGAEPDCGYAFLGLMAFEDPVRAGVADAVAEAQAAGIRVVMVTGDHRATAATIAAEIGIGAHPPVVVEGTDLERYLTDEGAAGLARLDVVARAYPPQKLDLVRALRRSGELVAVTGDGVNDVPALQGADVGIAMGERGTQTAREVASIVLFDDNFRTIVHAVAEGRQLFRNLRLSFAYLLMIHAPLVATAALIPLLGYPLLYLPVHIVWLELIIHPTALLVFQQTAVPGRLDAVGRDAAPGFFAWREWSIIAAVATVVTIVILWAYVRSLGALGDVEHARTMALVALIVASATITAGLTRMASAMAALVVALTVGSAVLLVQMPTVAALLHLKPLHADDWLVAVSSGVVTGMFAALLPARRRRASA
ncbi:MAG: cation-transporting P-type ATPase [Alphaproteobacteria bacterium]|nr:cation-transporting P-type ATPase [Alphaproteobacteria bacterium]